MNALDHMADNFFSGGCFLFAIANGYGAGRCLGAWPRLRRRGTAISGFVYFAAVAFFAAVRISGLLPAVVNLKLYFLSGGAVALLVLLLWAILNWLFGGEDK